MIITERLLNQVSSQAKESPRLRMNYNLHEHLSDNTHRFFNAMEPGTIVPIHRHRDTAETIILIKGKMHVVLYDSDKNIIEEAILCIEQGNYGIHIPVGIWHWVEILEPNTVTFEVKEGPYHPITDSDIFKISEFQELVSI